MAGALSRLYACEIVLLGSICGELLRLSIEFGILALADAPVSTWLGAGEGILLLRLIRALAPNALGSLLMGVLVGMRSHFKIGPRTYEAIASGFLGSLTTCAVFIRLDPQSSSIDIKSFPFSYLVHFIVFVDFLRGWGWPGSLFLWTILQFSSSSLLSSHLPSAT